MSSPARGYDFRSIEPKWQAYWEQHQTFRAPNPGEPGFDPQRPKYYVLDMFPYPSGAGLHVGHPEGYTATDIIARMRRMQGYNVLHPMGYDAFGLPAEQYAIEHGVHPAVTTQRNIENIRRQIKRFGFSYDWSRELSTCDVGYYRWTQWIFREMFESFYDETYEWVDDLGTPQRGKARPIRELVAELEADRWRVDEALSLVPAGDSEGVPGLRRWGDLDEKTRRAVLDAHRLAYLAEVPVNWCPRLGTVLANEEVTAEGRSERGNFPVYRRPLRQWMLRITKYADRLERDLDRLDWPESIKTMQRNWIGRSEGAEVDFPIAPRGGDEAEIASWFERRRARGFPARAGEDVIRVFTTRPDTLYGATYMVLAPEHPLVAKITTPNHRAEVEAYVEQARHRADLERIAETREKTGVFTGAYAINPVTREAIPIWIADYVLMTYGTGAIMAVPGHDARDFEFAKKYGLPCRTVVLPPLEWLREQLVTRGLDVAHARRTGREAIIREIERIDTVSAEATIFGEADLERILADDPGWLEQIAVPLYCRHPDLFFESYDGEGTGVNSPAQRGDAETCDLNGLTTAEAKGRITAWLSERGLGRFAVNYRLRDWLFSRQRYWGEPIPILHGPDGEIRSVPEEMLPVELPEMADFTPQASDDPNAEPVPPLARAGDWQWVELDGKRYRRELNTMPQWAGSCWYYLRYLSPRDERRFVDPEAERYWMPVDLYVGGAEHAVLHLLYARFWHKVLYDLGHVSTPEPFMKLFNQGMIRSYAYRDSRGVYVSYEEVEQREDGAYHRVTGEKLTVSVEKMSKSLKNVINPDEVLDEFGADVFRLYEMYMGPLDASKPWNTRDVPGLSRFLNRVWRLMIDEQTGEVSGAVQEVEAEPEVARLLHKTIRKVTEDIESLKFNTAIAHLITFVNEMTRRRVRPRGVLETFVLLLSPFAPHIAEELWQRLKGPAWRGSLATEPWPTYDPELARDEVVEIAVQINGKVRARVQVPADADEEHMKSAALSCSAITAALADRNVRFIKCVPGRLVNIVAE